MSLRVPVKVGLHQPVKGDQQAPATYFKNLSGFLYAHRQAVIIFPGLIFFHILEMNIQFRK